MTACINGVVVILQRHLGAFQVVLPQGEVLQLLKADGKSILTKLAGMTDEEFDSLELYPDI